MRQNLWPEFEVGGGLENSPRGACMIIELPLCILGRNARAHLKENDNLSRKRQQRDQTMALEMKSDCEKCGRKLKPEDPAYICTFECTFCPDCTTERDGICPNCGGELVRRPRPKKSDSLR